MKKVASILILYLLFVYHSVSAESVLSVGIGLTMFDAVSIFDNYHYESTYSPSLYLELLVPFNKYIGCSIRVNDRLHYTESKSNWSGTIINNRVSIMPLFDWYIFNNNKNAMVLSIGPSAAFEYIHYELYHEEMGLSSIGSGYDFVFGIGTRVNITKKELGNTQAGVELFIPGLIELHTKYVPYQDGANLDTLELIIRYSEINFFLKFIIKQ
jgi:hypothetical protein